MLLSWMRAAEPFGGWSLRQVQVNGQPGAMVSDAAGKLIAVLVLDIAADGHIQAVRSIVNPDKLRHLDHDDAMNLLVSPSPSLTERPLADTGVSFH